MTGIQLPCGNIVKELSRIDDSMHAWIELSATMFSACEPLAVGDCKRLQSRLAYPGEAEYRYCDAKEGS